MAAAGGARDRNVREQLQHLGALLEGHSPLHAGALEGSHQLAAVVDLAVLGEQQAGLEVRADAGHLRLQPRPVERFPQRGGGVGVALGGGVERHHDAAGAQPAAQAAVGFDLGHPGRNPLQAGLAQGQQRAAQPLGVGGEHAGGHEAGRLAAPAAEHGHGPAAARQLVGH